MVILSPPCKLLSGFKPSLASLNDLMQKTKLSEEATDKGGEVAAKEKLRVEEEKTSITAASYSLHADSINIHFLYVSSIFISKAYHIDLSKVELFVYTSRNKLRER